MKKSHIAIIVVIALSVAWLISRIGANDFSTYQSFTGAEKNMGQQVKVIGSLDLNEEISFDPNTIMLSFTCVDKDGRSSKVYLNKTKPQDFERSEEITLTGIATDTAFIASEILMKCPSKYNEQNQMAGNNDSEAI
ncbi:MAG: cytochrome c maturation protein CcmE [Schleiferiaceae bacterium]|jgi:cytochrome c-type biogenesis protein CcmE|nr:cytochrome c maturation protein CcmE [Schleiferiaceae bacterium]